MPTFPLRQPDQSGHRRGFLRASGSLRRRRTATVLVALLASLSLGIAAVALARPRPAPASLDGRFGSRGVVALGQGYQLFGVATQRDGKVIVAGDQRSRSGLRLVVARLTSSGRLDRSFNHGRVQFGPAQRTGGSIGRAVAIQPDGKILVAGVVTDRPGIGHAGMLVERFSPTGGLDRRFGSRGVATLLGGTANGAAYAVALQRDGKIIVAGSALGTDGLDQIALARLDARGRPDRGFAAGGVRLAQGAQDLGRDGAAAAVAVQPSGKIVVAGSVRPNLQNANAIVGRFSSRGDLDRSFGSGGSFVVPANVLGGGAVFFQALAVAGDGSLAAAGSAAGGGATPAYALAARLSRDGRPLGSFGRAGIVSRTSDRASVAPSPLPGANAVGITRRGVVVMAGSFQDSGRTEVSLSSFTARGSLIRSGSAVTVLSKSLGSVGANALAVDPQGRILVAGTSDNFVAFNGIVLRYHGFGR